MKQEDRKSKFGITREFAMINWWVTWVAIIIMAGYNILTTKYLKEEFMQALAIMKKESNGVIMLDKLGRPLTAKKAPMDITSESFKKVVLNNIQSYFIWDWTSLTDNYKNKILNVNDLERFNPKFKEFKENFIKKDDKKAQRDFLSFEKYIVFLIQNDKMPEMISVNSSKVTSYHTDKDTFDAKIAFVLVANIYNTQSGEYENRRGSMSVEVEGEFDSTRGTIINPLGLKYSTIKSSLLTKD